MGRLEQADAYAKVLQEMEEHNRLHEKLHAETIIEARLDALERETWSVTGWRHKLLIQEMDSLLSRLASLKGFV